MDKNEAVTLLKQHVKKDSLISHCLATAAVMKGLAKELGEDETSWELIGVLHDIDFEEINEDMEKHGIASYEILKATGISDDIALPIKHHNHMVFGGTYTEKVEICLQTADSVSGLVIACAYVKGGNLSDVSVKTITKKYKTASFAAGCDRNRIASTDSLIPRDRMYEIAISSLLEIKDELGLS